MSIGLARLTSLCRIANPGIINIVGFINVIVVEECFAKAIGENPKLEGFLGVRHQPHIVFTTRHLFEDINGKWKKSGFEAASIALDPVGLTFVDEHVTKKSAVITFN